jgi:hypothetical protein
MNTTKILMKHSYVQKKTKKKLCAKLNMKQRFKMKL